eukprot:scpid60690/ scgid9158/ 
MLASKVAAAHMQCVRCIGSWSASAAYTGAAATRSQPKTSSGNRGVYCIRTVANTTTGDAQHMHHCTLVASASASAPSSSDRLSHGPLPVSFTLRRMCSATNVSADPRAKMATRTRGRESAGKKDRPLYWTHMRTLEKLSMHGEKFETYSEAEKEAIFKTMAALVKDYRDAPTDWAFIGVLSRCRQVISALRLLKPPAAEEFGIIVLQSLKNDTPTNQIAAALKVLPQSAYPSHKLSSLFAAKLPIFLNYLSQLIGHRSEMTVIFMKNLLYFNRGDAKSVPAAEHLTQLYTIFARSCEHRQYKALFQPKTKVSLILATYLQVCEAVVKMRVHHEPLLQHLGVLIQGLLKQPNLPFIQLPVAATLVYAFTYYGVAPPFMEILARRLQSDSRLSKIDDLQPLVILAWSFVVCGQAVPHVLLDRIAQVLKFYLMQGKQIKLAYFHHLEQVYPYLLAAHPQLASQSSQLEQHRPRVGAHDQIVQTLQRMFPASTFGVQVATGGTLLPLATLSSVNEFHAWPGSVDSALSVVSRPLGSVPIAILLVERAYWLRLPGAADKLAFIMQRRISQLEALGWKVVALPLEFESDEALVTTFQETVAACVAAKSA